MSRAVLSVFENYRIQRHTFAQTVADFSQRPEYAQQIIQQGGIILLRNLLTDTSPAIQQNACLAVGRLSGHDPNIANLMIKQDIMRILLFFNMDKSNKYLKRAALMAIRNVVRHSSDLARSVIDIGGLDQIVASLADFDPGVKEAAGWVCGSIAKHDMDSAHSIIGAGAVPLLIICLQEPEVIVRSVAANALSEICKHSPETSQTVIDTGAITHLVRAMSNVDPKLKRQAMNGLASIAKQSMDMAEIIIESETVVQLVLEHCCHIDELVRKAACGLIREIVKHSPELAQLIVEAGGLGVLVNAVIRNRGDSKLPGIMALGYISGHTPALALSVVYSKGTDALAVALSETGDGHVGAAAAWALGHTARHSAEHAKYVSTCGILPRILEIYMTPESTDEMKEKAKQALKMILLRTDDLENVEPLLSTAPPNILKYVVAQYSKVLPRDPAARRAFVTSGGLRKLQELLATEASAEGSVLREHIILINQCFPEDVVKYFSPDYPNTLLERVEQFQPSLNIDPAMWSERLFSDTKIPAEIKEEILALQKMLQKTAGDGGMNGLQSIDNEEEEEEEVVPETQPLAPSNQSMKRLSARLSKAGTITGSTAPSKLKGKK